VADRLGGHDRVVWATDGKLTTVRNRQTGVTRAVLRHTSGEPRGRWIPSEPGYAPTRGTAPKSITTVDGEVVPDSDVVRYTLLTKKGQKSFGWASYSPEDLVEREKAFLDASAVEHWRRDYEQLDVAGRLHKLAGPAIGYAVFAHGNEKYVKLRQENGTVADVDYEQFGEYLQRDPGLKRLGADQAVDLHVCQAGSRAPGGDALVVPRNGQKVANIAGVRVRAMPTKVAFEPPSGEEPAVLWLANSTDLPEVFPRFFSPEPSEERLQELAERYLLVNGLSPDQPRERMVRMVRAVNEIFGIDSTSEPRLLEAFGRLERMRLADEDYAGQGRGGPLTWALLEDIARRYAQQDGALEPDEVGGWPLLSVMREMLGKALAEKAGTPGMALTEFLTDSKSFTGPTDLPAALDPAAWYDGPLETWEKHSSAPPAQSSGAEEPEQPGPSGEPDNMSDEVLQYPEGEWNSPDSNEQTPSLDTVDKALPVAPSTQATTSSLEPLVSGGTRVPEFVSASKSPVGREGWWPRRARAASARLDTEMYDPAQDPLAGEKLVGDVRWLGGRRTLVRVDIRRVQAFDGRWVRDLEIVLPVRPGAGFSAGELGAFEAGLSRLLDERVNIGFVLPASGDQLNLGVRLVHAPGHRQAVEISRTEEPGSSDQLHLRLHTATAAADAAVVADADAGGWVWDRQDDNLVLHELLHYAGVTDRYHDAESLFRNVPGKADASGVMADLSAPADGRLPADYLKAIEAVTDSGPVVYDLPLPVPGDTTEGETWSRERPLTVSARRSGTGTASVQAPWIYLSPLGSTAPPALLDAGSGPGPERDRWHLPAYLESMRASGTATFHDLEGTGWIAEQIRANTSGGSPQEILAALEEAPETFLGHGRPFHLKGGDAWYDVTVAMNRHPDEPRPLLTVLDTPSVRADATANSDMTAHKAAVERSSLAMTGRSTQNAQGWALSGNGYVLVPVSHTPLLLGASLHASLSLGQRVTTRTERHASAHAQVLASPEGTVEVPRRVQWSLRIQKAWVPNARSLTGDGRATATVPLAELVPQKEPSRLGPATPVDQDTARRIALAFSLQPLSVDPGAPYEGGRGVFDAVTAQLHPSLVGPGTQGRSDVHDALRADVLTRKLPRMLVGWTLSEDLASSWGKTSGGYRMRATVTQIAPVIRRAGADRQGTRAGVPSFPALVSMQSAARTHGVRDSDASGGTVELGPGAGFIGGPFTPRVRFFLQPGLELARSGWSGLSQEGTTLQGSEIDGDRVLYLAQLRLEVEGTGPTSPLTRRGPSVTNIRAWLYLRAQEAVDMGLPLPTGTKPGPLFTHPGFDRTLTVGPSATSTVWSGLDTAPLLERISDLFAGDGRLKGFLPAFGGRDDVPAWRSSETEGKRMRANWRALENKLSSAYLSNHRKALLAGGVQAHLVRRGALSVDHAVVRVRARQEAPSRYTGDVDDWGLLYGPGLTSELSAGHEKRRGVSLRFRLNSTVIPNHLYANAMFGGAHSNVRNGQGSTLIGTGGGTRTAGQPPTSGFDTELILDIDVTLMSRPSDWRRVATPGLPGRQTPPTQLIATTGPVTDRSTASLSVDPVKVRLAAPASLTYRGRPPGEASSPTGQLPQALPIAVPPLRGLSDMYEARWAPPRPGERRLTQWLLLEDPGTAQFLHDRALELLTRASGGDDALGAPELESARKIEEVFGPDAVSEGFEIAAHHVWLADNLYFDRRVSDLRGAVGARLHAVRPRVRHVADGPAIDHLAVGGHQASGSRTKGSSASAELFLGGAGSFTQLVWQLGGTGYTRTWSRARQLSSGVSATVKYSTATEPGGRMVLVQADLDVLMAAEVSVRGKTPTVETYGGKLPGVVSVWLSETQVRELGMEQDLADHLAGLAPKASPGPLAPPLPPGTPTTSAGQGEAGRSRTAPPAKSAGRPAGTPVDKAAHLRLVNNGAVTFGALEKAPDFTRLLPALRTELARLRGQKFADRLLPHHLVPDRHRNVQRLMTVLSRVGFRGLQAGAVDGGVPVTLYQPDGTVAYVARFTVERGPGVFHDRPADRKSLIATAEAGLEHSQGTVRSVTDTGSVSTFGVPSIAGGERGIGFHNAALSIGSTTSAGHTTSANSGLKNKLTAPADTPVLRMRHPLTAHLELFAPGQDEGGGPAAAVPLPAPAEGEDDRWLLHRMLEADVRALAGVRPPRPLPAPERLPVVDLPPLARWQETGTPVPPESQVLSFADTAQARTGLRRLLTGLKASKDFRTTGTVPALTVDEVLATEWITTALPTLAAVGGFLPDDLVSGLPKGEGLRLRAGARFTNGEILGVGDPMEFEYTPGVTLGRPRRTAEGAVTANVAAVSSGSPSVGGGWLNSQAGIMQMHTVTGNRETARTTVSESAQSSGELPRMTVTEESVLVQFDVDLRLRTERDDSARPVDGEPEDTSAGGIEIPLRSPMVLRMTRSSAERLLAAGHIADPALHLPDEARASLAATDEDLPFAVSQAPPGYGGRAAPTVRSGVQPGSVTDPRQRLLHEVFGVQLNDERFGEYLAGLEVLEAVRASDAEFRRQPLGASVLRKMAHRVLRLSDGQPVTVDGLWKLYNVAQEAWTAGRAGSVVAVAAYYLDRHLGVFSGPDYVAGPNNGSVPGRNWLGGRIPPLDVDHGGYLGGPREVMKWAGQRPYVLLANGGPLGVQVADHRGDRHWVGAEELAELLRHDPVMPGDGPVVFLVSLAGAGGLELPRLVAERLGGRNRVVWATDGKLAFEADSQTGFTRLVLDNRMRAEMPVGKWIPSRPGYVHLPGAEPGFFRTVDGEEYPDGRVMWYTISRPDNAETMGRSSLGPQATAQDAEHEHPFMLHMGLWVRGFDGPNVIGRAHNLGGPQIGYWAVAHGLKDAVELWLTDGTEVRVDHEQFGGLLRRRPSFQKLRADQAVQLHVCHGGSLFPAGDRLEMVRNGQLVANAAGRMVRATPGEVEIEPPTADGRPAALLLWNPTEVPEVFPRLFFPEPSGRVLEGLTGRYLGGPDGVLPAQPEERMLRMMRAVNEIFGIDPASDPRLLEAFGRLERMRLADRNYAGERGGPLTWGLLEEIAGQYAQRQERWQRSGVPSGWPLLRVMREMLGKALDPWALSPGMTLTWFLEHSSRVAAVRLPRALDPAFWDDGPSDAWQEIQTPAFSPPVDSSVLRGTRVPEFVSPSEDPVGREGWWSRREWAAAARLVTEIYDPARDPFDAGRPAGTIRLVGRHTLVRADVRRVQAVDGRWVRDLEIVLPVRPGDGFAAGELAGFEAGLNTLLDERVNIGFVLPVSGDQLNLGVRLVHVPEYRQAVEISRAGEPGRSDQLHFRLHTTTDAERSAGHRLSDDNMVLHELLHYAGVTDRYHDPESLFRDVPGRAFTSGTMADLSAPADGRLPADYLKAIETATDSGPVVYDLPLSAPVPGDTTEGEKWFRERQLTVSARQSGTATVPVDASRIHLSPHGSTVPPVPLHEGFVSGGLPDRAGALLAASAQALVSPTTAETAPDLVDTEDVVERTMSAEGVLPTGMGRDDFEMLRAEVVRELRRLGWGGDPVTAARVARLHDGLPAWRRRGTVRARGEAIAQIIRTGEPARLLGGGSGLEGEYTYLVSLPAGLGLEDMDGVALATGPDGALVVVETKEVYIGPSGRYYRQQHEARAAGGSGAAVEMPILETIIGVARNLPGEDLRVGFDQVFLAYEDAERSFDAIRGERGSPPSTPIEEVLRWENGWQITDDGQGTLLGPRPIGDWPGAHVHYNIGVPLAVMHRFLEHVRDNTWRDRSRGYLTRDHLSDALLFADTIAMRFISWKNLQGQIPQNLESLRSLVGIGDLEVQVLRGHATLLYEFAAMLATAYSSEGLDKVHAAVLPRHAPDVMLQGLPDRVQNYLRSDQGVFLDTFENYFLNRIARFNATRGRGAVGNEQSVRPLRVVKGYLRSGLDISAQRVDVNDLTGMNILGGLDVNNGSTLPLTVVEVRSYMERHVDCAAAKEYHNNLVDFANYLYINMAMRLHYPPSRDLEKLRQVYESRFGRRPGPSQMGSIGGVRGGTRDTGVDPVAAGWPVGRAVTVEGPRRGGVDEVPVSEVPEMSSGAGKAAERWFVRSSEHSSAPGYEYSDASRIALPDGEVLSGKEWMRFGDDFVHMPSGALLRGDSGWIGRVANMESLRDVIVVLDTEAAPYTLVADASALFLVPMKTGGQAVRIALPGNTALAEGMADISDASVIRDLPPTVNAPDVAHPDARSVAGAAGELDWSARVLFHDIRDAKGRIVGRATFTPDDWKHREPALSGVGDATDYVEWRRSSDGRLDSGVRPLPLPNRPRFYVAGHGTREGVEVIGRDGTPLPLGQDGLVRIVESWSRSAKLSSDTLLVLLACGPMNTDVGRRLAAVTGLTVVQPRWSAAATPPLDGRPARLHMLEAPDGSPGGLVLHHPGGRSETYEPDGTQGRTATDVRDATSYPRREHHLSGRQRPNAASTTPPAYAKRTEIVHKGRPRGRNWTGADIDELDMSVTHVYQQVGQRELKLISDHPAPWGSGAWTVVADGDAGHVMFPGPDGRPARVPVEQAAAWVLNDPGLTRYPPDADVVLIVPGVGGQQMTLVRDIANGTGRRVWATYGEARAFRPPRRRGISALGDRRRHVAALVSRVSAGKLVGEEPPLGTWLVVDPAPGALPPVPAAGFRTMGGEQIPDSEVHVRPAVTANRLFGGVSMEDDSRGNESATMLTTREIAKVTHQHMSGADMDSEYLPRELIAAVRYRMSNHGLPGAAQLHLKSGRTVGLSGREYAQWLGRQRGIRELDGKAQIWLNVCWSASATDRALPPSFGEAAPSEHLYVADPLEPVIPALGQEVANVVQRIVWGGTRPTGFDFNAVDGSVLTPLTHIAAADGTRGRLVKFKPEPPTDQLGALAVAAGLWPAGTAVPAGVGATALRLTRALREVFGLEVEDDAHLPDGTYARRLRGVGALERMRANDPELGRLTPFTLDLLDHVARAHSGLHPTAKPDIEHYRSVLKYAVRQVQRSERSALLATWSIPWLDESLRVFADAEKRADRVREILGVAPAASLEGRDFTRAFWSSVRATAYMQTLGAAGHRSLAAAALHLTVPPTEAHVKQWRLLLAASGAAGRDITDPVAVGVYDLVRRGALSKATMLPVAGRETPSARNWTRARLRQLTDAQVQQLARNAKGALYVEGMLRAPWAADAEYTAPYVVLAEPNPTGVDLTLPGDVTLVVSLQELAELIRLDHVHLSLPPTSPVVLGISGAGYWGDLMRDVTYGTGRDVVAPYVSLAFAGAPTALSQVPSDGPAGWIWHRWTSASGPAAPQGSVMRQTFSGRPDARERAGAHPAYAPDTLTDRTQSPTSTSSTAAFSSSPLLVQDGADREHLVVRGDGRSLALALSDALRSRPSQRPENGGGIPWPVADGTTDADAVAAGFDSWLDTQLTEDSDGDGAQAVSGLLPADDGTVVTETDLRDAGVVLDAGRQMRLVLSGNAMSLAELGLSPVQRLRLLLHGPQSPEATYARAVLAARKLGIRLVFTGADGTEHGIGEVTAPVIRLLSDDWHRPFLPEQGE
jgi:hypothetical protein